MSDLNRWASSQPRWLLATFGILAGLVLIFLANPPHTVCQSQLDIFREEQSGVLFAPQSRPKVKRDNLFQQTERCKQVNSQGGCYEMFQSLRKILRDLKQVPSECRNNLADLREVRGALTTSMETMALLAWAGKPPSSAADRMGWFDSSDMNLFCRIKDQYVDLYGQENWKELSSALLISLPSSQSLPRSDSWARTILSANCTAYR